MELKQFDRVLFKLLYIVEAGIIITQILGMETITSSFFLLTFPLTAALWMRCIRKTVTATDIIVIATAVFAIISVLLDAGFTNASLSFSYLKKLIMFVMTLLFLQTAFKFRIDGDMMEFIIGVADIITLFFIAAYFIFGIQMYTMNGRISQYLTFRFTNPNLTALFLVCFYIIELYRLFSPEKWQKKIIHIAMAVFLGFFLIQTQSRNSLMVFVAVTFVCLFLIFFKNRKMYINKKWAVFIALFPMLFVMAYMLLLNNQWIQNAFDFLISAGKGLDSRMLIWESTIKSLGGSPLIGAYNEISFGTGASQMHNSHLDIACSYGIPVLILVCVLLAKYLHQKKKIYKHKENFIYMLGFACAILLGMGEAALFSGGLGIYIFIGTFILMAGKKDNES